MKRLISLPNILLLLGSLALAAPTFAQQYVVDVHGIVCEFCSYGVAKKVRKLDFIDPSQFDKGVKVDIEKQMVYIAVSDNAALDKSALFKAIESGGYKPVTLWRIAESGEKVEVQ
jgi:hypothetical protein